MVQGAFLIEREATFGISKRRRVGGEAWREWKAGEKGSLPSQCHTERGRSGDCGIGENGKLGSFGGGMRGWRHASHCMSEWKME